MTKALLFTTLLILSACSDSRKHVYFEQETLDRISSYAKIEPVPPFFYASAPVFVLSNDDSIVVTNFANLHQAYLNDHKRHYSRFADFLFDALNQNIKIFTSHLPLNLLYAHKFKPDSNIASIYSTAGLTGVINRYVLTEKNGFRLKEPPLSMNQINTITFYFFINQYLRQDDDYRPSIHFYKLSFLLEHIGVN